MRPLTACPLASGPIVKTATLLVLYVGGLAHCAAVPSSSSSLPLEFVRVLDASGLRLEGLRRWRLWYHARLPQQLADGLRWLCSHCQPVPAPEPKLMVS